MDSGQYPYPLPISRALQAADSDSPLRTPHSALHLADALTYYLGAVAVGQYSRATLTGDIAPDPTLNRSLRSLRRVLPGQWLLWIARSLEATPDGPVEGMAAWYNTREHGPVVEAYSILLYTMREKLDYTGDYGDREQASPRDLLELIDQFRIRLGKVGEAALSPEDASIVSGAIESGLRAAIESARFLTAYQLYAHVERKLLMGLEPTTPMPPISSPPFGELLTLLLYPPGEPPDYTKRPKLDEERMPLFPLDPLLSFLWCATCDTHRIFALREAQPPTLTYAGLDPDCGHIIQGEARRDE
jgi:hypothetical protein